RRATGGRPATCARTRASRGQERRPPAPGPEPTGSRPPRPRPARAKRDRPPPPGPEPTRSRPPRPRPARAKRDPPPPPGPEPTGAIGRPARSRTRTAHRHGEACRGSPRTGRDRAGNSGAPDIPERGETYEPTDLPNTCDTSTSVPHGWNLNATS